QLGRHQGGDGLAAGDVFAGERFDPWRCGVAEPDDVVAFALDVAGDDSAACGGESDGLISLFDLPVGPEDGFDDLIERHPRPDSVEGGSDHAALVADLVTGGTGEL